MSQRLLIGLSDEVEAYGGYDAVLTERDDYESAFVKLDRDYFMRVNKQGQYTGHIIGPWKVRILNPLVFRQHEAVIRTAFTKVGEEFPGCLWGIYGRDGQEVERIEDLEG